MLLLFLLLSELPQPKFVAVNCNSSLYSAIASPIGTLQVNVPTLLRYSQVQLQNCANYVKNYHGCLL